MPLTDVALMEHHGHDSLVSARAPDDPEIKNALNDSLIASPIAVPFILIRGRWLRWRRRRREATAASGVQEDRA